MGVVSIISDVGLFAAIVVAIGILGGILLTFFLYFSDGPVVTVDESLVKSEENSDD